MGKMSVQNIQCQQYHVKQQVVKFLMSGLVQEEKHNIMSEFERKSRAVVHEYKWVPEKVSQNGSSNWGVRILNNTRKQGFKI